MEPLTFRIGAVVEASPVAFGRAFADQAPAGTVYRGMVVGRDEDDDKGVAEGRRVWRVPYDDDDTVWPTAQEHLTPVRARPEPTSPRCPRYALAGARRARGERHAKHSRQGGRRASTPTTAPSRTNTMSSEAGVFSIHMLIGAACWKSNHMPRWGGSGGRCIKPSLRLLWLSATSRAMQTGA